MAWLNVTNSATSLLIISASMRSAVPVFCSPPLSSIKPARILVRIVLFILGQFTVRAALDCCEPVPKYVGVAWRSALAFFTASKKPSAV
jgi:hypothetical protein